MTTRSFALAAAGAVLVGCTPEYVPSDLVPIMVVDPERLTFGEVGVGPGLSAQQSILVSNAGKAELQITSVTLEGQVAPFSVEPTELSVAPGAEGELVVTFVPLQEFVDYTARAVIVGNDEVNPEERVPITGTGAEAPAPDIEILPGQTLEWVDEISFGDSEQLDFSIKNVGEADLTLGAITLEVPAGVNPETFTIDWGPREGTTVRPGSMQTVLVTYAPDDEVGEIATVRIPSDDPDEPEVLVTLVGNGGGPYFEKPEAVIDCPATVLLTGPEWVRLDGSGSTDPAGYELTYKWTKVSHPPAHDTDYRIDPDDTPAVDVYADVAGPYMIQLVVTNEMGAASDPTYCTFDAVPEDDIHVELTWDGASADLDLHLVQSGAELFSIPGDCYWCNRSPDWGVEDDSNDDPRLDIDDRAGFGPENINVYRPVDGVYEVAVHFWQANGTPNQVATVKVWIEGAEVFSGSMPMAEEQLWEVGKVSIDSVNGSVWLPPDVAAPYDPGNVGCPN